MSHKWMDSYYNNCCSCGWRCSKNSTGTHTRHECKDEYAEHLERVAREHTQEPPDDMRDAEKEWRDSEAHGRE